MKKRLLKILLSLSWLIPCLSMISCATQSPSQLTNIDITLPINNISIETGQEYLSQEIIVNCYDQNGNKIEAEIEWEITLSDGSIAPNWLSIIENKINIKGNILPSIYQFNIWAIDKETHLIKSSIKQLAVEIKPKPLLPPDKIKIRCEKQEHLVFFTQEYQINLDIEATREDTDPKQVSKECHWIISNVVGPKESFKYDDLFSLQTNKNSSILTINKNLDDSFKGFYYVEIQAWSILNLKANDSITLIIELENGLKFEDEIRHYVYTRKNFSDPWALSILDSRTSVIYDLQEEIFGYPVSRIDDNLCAKNGITKLGTVRLPTSIKEIGDNAFSNQPILLSIDMPGVCKIGKNAFANDIQLEIINEDKVSLQYVDFRAFYNCNKLTLNSHNKFVYIGQEAFANTGLTQIDLGPDIAYIDNNAFASCPNLKNITLQALNPPGLGGALYYGSTNPNSIEIPKNSIEIYKNNLKWSVYKDKFVGI